MLDVTDIGVGLTVQCVRWQQRATLSGGQARTFYFIDAHGQTYHDTVSVSLTRGGPHPMYDLQPGRWYSTHASTLGGQYLHTYTPVPAPTTH